jgi:hypothetical protein
MKNRIIRKLLSWIWKYTASTVKNSELEATRYCNYITENYSVLEQLLIIKGIKKKLIEYREDQLKNLDIQEMDVNDKRKLLVNNLTKITSLT